MAVVKFEDREQLREQTYYLATAIAYLNGPPHVGHAYEFTTADIIARYHRIVGRQTLFATGSDEHGQKVEQTATKNGVTPQEWCDRTVKSFYDLNTKLNIGEHVFLRTTSANHKACAQWLWNRCNSRGDIYKGAYRGWYNVKEETFVTDREAEAHGYKCPITGAPYEERSEEAYFFRLSKYHDQIVELLSSDDFAQPEGRRNELVQRLKKAELEDLCVSRSTLTWGVPVPGDPEHVMYVWFDALSNYLSVFAFTPSVASENSGSDGLDVTALSSYKKFWPMNVHIIGKDITWFHCVIWPAMLLSAGLPLPKRVFAHGFIQSADGVKMSKSLANGLSPMEVLDVVSCDTFRFYIAREGTYGSDIRFNQAALIDMHNADLCSVIGNLVHRVVALAVQACEGKIPDVAPQAQIVDLRKLFETGEAYMDQLSLEEFARLGVDICKDVNKYLTEQAPWKIKPAAPKPAAIDDGAATKQADQAAPGLTVEEVRVAKSAIIRASLEAVYIAAHYLFPVVPKAASGIFERLGHERKLICELKEGTNLVPGTQLKPSDVLFTHLQ